MKDDFPAWRRWMVEKQIRERGVANERVLAAMLKVERERFVPASEKLRAYDDGPLSIGHGQTISQPYIVAYMSEMLDLQGCENVLEIGTGSGYQTAILAELAAQVFTVEIIPELHESAARLLSGELQYGNIRFRLGQGKEGWPEFAPFDRIIVTAAADRFPENLYPQLREGGSALAPLGEYFQRLVRLRKRQGRIHTEELIGVAFVPLV